MTVYAKMRVDGLILNPVPASSAGDGEMYNDQDSTQISVKGSGSDTTPIGPSGSSSSPLIKVMENLSGGDIPAGSDVCKRPDGSIAMASSDTPGFENVIGIANVDIPNAATGAVGLLGPNFPAVLTGLGFTPGDIVYMAESSGQYTNDLTTFTNSDRIVQVGIADCAAGTASTTVTDLLGVLVSEVVP
jgi:hypothetical protein